ncbi:MAG: glycosyltransferase family 4 protein [Methanobacteriota archaeon]
MASGPRILKIAPSVFSPANRSSGIKTYTLTLTHYLRDKGFEVKILGASLDGVGLPSEHLVEIPEKSDLLFSLYLLPHFIKLKGDFDLIHSSDPFLTLPILQLISRKPFVLTLHEDWASAVKYKKGFFHGLIARIVEYFSLRWAWEVIVVDGKLGDTYLKKYGWLKGKIHVIDVGVDLKAFKPLKNGVRKKFGLSREDKVVLYVGRFEKEKNLTLLLKAFRIVRKEMRKSKLVLVGSGKEKQKLIDFQDKLKLKNVVFMNPVESETVPEILNCADVLTITSKYESCPLIAQESLACGTPVVSVDVGRVRNLISNNLCGKVVSRDPINIAETILSYLKKDKEKTTKACVNCIKEFSFDKTIEKTIKVYEKTLTGLSG